MNSDGSDPVAVEASVGVKADWVLPFGVGRARRSVCCRCSAGRRCSCSVPWPWLAASRPRRPAARPPPGRSRSRAVSTIPAGWLWLVKWILVIPHLIVLAVLWLTVVVVSIVAFFAILFTGRYPRSLFDFVVGVMRWTWRVGFYSFSALATDRYPPFTLGVAPDYPATLDVAYPAQLSRGLVLVKWWLLAIPHYMVLAFLVGGGAWAAENGGAWAGGGLLGLLVVFVGLALLFSGRYPGGLFDLVMGLNRWAFRVAAYVGLLTDEYPPFRLDQGPEEPPQRASS